MRNLLILLTLSCSPSIAERFALENMAQKYHDDHGMVRHSCDMRNPMVVDYSNCYGLLDNGLIVKYRCSLVNSSSQCELVPAE